MRELTGRAADFRLKHYYATVPSAAPPRCPTWVFVAAAQQAFAGSGELEEGTIILEDIICVLSSLIDQVCAISSRANSRAWSLVSCRTRKRR